MQKRLPPIDVAYLRHRLQMSQKLFAARFGFSLAAIRHWEHGDRRPGGAALVLLTVVRDNPRAVASAILKARWRQGWPYAGVAAPEEWPGYRERRAIHRLRAPFEREYSTSVGRVARQARAKRHAA